MRDVSEQKKKSAPEAKGATAVRKFHTHSIPLDMEDIARDWEKPVVDAGIAAKASVIVRVGMLDLGAGTGSFRVREMMHRIAYPLGIPFYNREIITMASEDSGVNAMLFSDERLKGDFLTRLRAHYHGNAPVPNDSSKSYLKDEALFAYQVKIIRRLADQGPCVMIGRCADYILAGRTDVVRVFVHADKDFCLEQAMKVDSLPQQEVEKKIAEIDDYRARYYKHHTGHDWYDARNYDLSLNSGVLGFDGTVEEIIKYMEVREQFQK